jgi:hypothetical protein
VDFIRGMDTDTFWQKYNPIKVDDMFYRACPCFDFRLETNGFTVFGAFSLLNGNYVLHLLDIRP